MELPRDLSLLQCCQKLTTSIALMAADGRTKLPGTINKLKRWKEQFEQVCNISMAVVDGALNGILEVIPQEISVDGDDEILPQRKFRLLSSISRMVKNRAGRHFNFC